MKNMISARAYRDATALALESIPIPVAGEQDVVIRVASAGLAPGMMKLLERGRFRHLPTTPGHEFAGTVVDVGRDVDSAWLGKRVRAHAILSCGECVYCRTDREQMCTEAAMVGHAALGDGPLELYARYHDGGLAEFVRVPHWLLDELPDNVSFDVGAKIHDLGNAVRALKCAALPSTGRLVITAATGTMGTASIKLAAFLGARELVLVGRSAERLGALKPLAVGMPVHCVALQELGSDWPASGTLTRRLLEIWPSGADAVLDFFPEGPGTAQAAAALATGGALVHMGGNRGVLPFSIRDIMHHCWRIVGTRSCTRSDTGMVIDLLRSGLLHADDLITHRFPLGRVNEALDAAASRTTPMWMTVVHPNRD
ncbi:theronine dehydrogenase [Burkholderia cenocepacia]|uniref:alcohol dehydrogenase catalytic domain-containing protein n=1 Tax=Burkholderia cenocepacia TaxID=95486 RepID=UPI000F571FD5|nr:alcohol dehydrogenase catalytic domain-containing protein [Burkholderia cenocepacia]RQU32814.1 theronine dehydrogenase [Burkholderia cenocepacia]RQU55187.1 theronine dehydrogenase [Burkholderia cenocepacia]